MKTLGEDSETGHKPQVRFLKLSQTLDKPFLFEVSNLPGLEKEADVYGHGPNIFICHKLWAPVFDLDPNFIMLLFGDTQKYVRLKLLGRLTRLALRMLLLD